MQMNYLDQAEMVREHKSTNSGKIASVPSPWVSPLSALSFYHLQSHLCRKKQTSLSSGFHAHFSTVERGVVVLTTCFELRHEGLFTFPSSQEGGTQYETLAEREAKRSKDKADVLGQTVSKCFQDMGYPATPSFCWLTFKTLKNYILSFLYRNTIYLYTSIQYIHVYIYMYNYICIHIYVCMYIVRTQYICTLLIDILICN